MASNLLYNIIWVSSLKRTKTLTPREWVVNIYVLTKMPRDCTAPPFIKGRCDEQSGFMFAGSNTKHD